MTAERLIQMLSQYPPGLTVLAFSSNPEKWGQIEDLWNFQLQTVRYGYLLDGVQFPADAEGGRSFIVISTGMHLGLSAEKAINALTSFDLELPVVFEPYGSSAAHRYVEVAEVKMEKFGVFKRKFRDLTDGRDFLEDVYEEDANGLPRLLLNGT